MTAFTPFYQAEDGNGVPYAGAKLYFYVTATSTPKNTFSDAGLTTPNTNPVVADANGRFGPIYLSTDQNYKVVMTTSADVTIATFDPFQVSGAVDIVNLTALTTPAVDDSVPIYDLSGTANKKITLENLFKVVALLTDKATPVPADILPITDSAASNVAKRATLAALLAAVNGLTEDTTPDQTADFLLTYDTSASLPKKVKASKVSGSEVLIQTLTFTGSSAEVFTAFDPARFSRYRFAMDRLSFTTDLTTLRFRVSVDAGANYKSGASDYRYGGRQMNAGTGGDFGDAADDHVPLQSNARVLSNVANEVFNGELTLIAPDLGGNVFFEWSAQFIDGTAGVYSAVLGGSYGQYYGTTDDVDGVQFSPAGGTFSGTIRCYGTLK